jgi:hypothetical protein
MEESKGKMVRKFRGKAAILKILQDQVDSGQNIKTYCASHGIAGGTFHRWKQKYGAGEDGTASGFTPVHILPEAGLFAMVGGIRIYQPVSAAYLKELMS